MRRPRTSWPGSPDQPRRAMARWPRAALQGAVGPGRQGEVAGLGRKAKVLAGQTSMKRKRKRKMSRNKTTRARCGDFRFCFVFVCLLLALLFVVRILFFCCARCYAVFL